MGFDSFFVLFAWAWCTWGNKFYRQSVCASGKRKVGMDGVGVGGVDGGAVKDLLFALAWRIRRMN